MIRRQISIFLIVGVATVGVDFATYRLLGSVTDADVNLCKGLGFIAGTVFSYFANRFWTFGQVLPERGSPVRFILLYAATLCANILANALVLDLLTGVVFRVEAAFVVATSISAFLNFLGMKYFVFRADETSVKK